MGLTVLGLVLGSPVRAADEPVTVVDMTVRLDPEKHALAGSGRLTWRNATTSPTAELHFHLYLNAFAGTRTTFMRELGRGSLRSATKGEISWGNIRLTRLVSGDGRDLLSGLEFVRPDDGNPDDFTVARVVLPDPVPAGGVVELELAFEAQLPSLVARTGFAGDFHLVGQWFPKLGVFEDAGFRGRPTAGWNCHQFHANSEFYSDFGSYRVSVEVPGGWVVGAAGVEVEREPLEVDGEPWQRVTYRADRIHDFVWTAAPERLMTVVEEQFEPGRDVPAGWLEEASRLLDRSAADLELPPVHLRLLLPSSQAVLAPRMLRAARLGLAWFGLMYGPYPYPQLTLVSPPPTAEEAGGMEYLTLVTTGASLLDAYPPFSWLSDIERVTVHEIGHQYFYGLLASNEFEEAWLDEGLTSYAEVSCLEAIARDRLVPQVRWGRGHWALRRVWLGSSGVPVRADQPAWEFPARSDYFRSNYGRVAVALKTLEGLLGRERMARALRTYAERFRFRHPTGDDLVATLAEVAGEGLSGLVEGALRGDAVPDWSVVRVTQRRPGPAEGWSWSGGGWDRVGEPEGDLPAAPWQVEVQLVRRGDLVGPVDVALAFADGSTERRRWESPERWERWSFESSSKLVSVVVDPDGVWALEVERSDNYWRAEPGREGARARLWWVRDAFSALGLLLLPWS